MFIFVENLSVELCRSEPTRIFIFGDNLLKRGKAGQATIRDEPNSFGIPTKRVPSMSDTAFFSDQDDEYAIVRSHLVHIWKLHLSGITIVLPCNKIGSGLANLEHKSPRIFSMIEKFYTAAMSEPAVFNKQENKDSIIYPPNNLKI